MEVTEGPFCVGFDMTEEMFLECKVQILGMAVVTLIFALLGFLSPAHRQCLTA